jgi:transposase
LRNAIENACKREGILVERVNPDYTTQECHLCGFTKKFDAAANIVHTCPGCNNKWDQDYNAAVVLLKRKLGYHVVAPTATI